jgi:hypothetical protein
MLPRLPLLELAAQPGTGFLSVAGEEPVGTTESVRGSAGLDCGAGVRRIGESEQVRDNSAQQQDAAPTGGEVVGVEVFGVPADLGVAAPEVFLAELGK